MEFSGKEIAQIWIMVIAAGVFGIALAYDRIQAVVATAIEYWKTTDNAVNIFIITLIPSFVLVGLVNQSAYNFCMKSRCLEAAFPKVLIFSIILAGIVTYFKEK